MSDSATQKSNLARIRDNQRRSRARRKEYLQELETKYRTCQETGVEASAEIQAAARRVVEENKRLRQLLKQQGISDVEIDGLALDTPENPQFPSAASALEGMLSQRKRCSTNCNTVATNDGRRQSCAPSIPQAQSQRTLSGHMITPENHYQSPVSTASTTSSGIPTPNNMQFPVSTPATYPAPVPVSRAFDYSMPYEDPMPWSTPYHTNTENITNAAQTTQTGASSCYAAASAIRTLKSDVGPELEEELGCGDGRECDVDNARIFEMMDRYSQGRI